MMLSVVIPVYKNEENVPRLVAEIAALQHRLPCELEAVFVVDGSPDNSLALLQQHLPGAGLRAELVSLSRNFGSFAAIAAGLARGHGDVFGVMAADLQEPPELMIQFADILLSGEADIVFGVRAGRSDPWFSEKMSTLFWGIYRRFVVREMPPGGVDVFGCTRAVRDRLLEVREINTNLIALLFWLGYRREFVPYTRLPRLEGTSAWTFAKKLQYCVNSIFNFTDLPLRFLLAVGAFGSIFAVVATVVVVISRFFGAIEVPGYTPIVLTITFFGGLTTFGLGIIGQYLWLTLQNTRGRPNYIVKDTSSYGSKAPDDARRKAFERGVR